MSAHLTDRELLEFAAKACGYTLLPMPISRTEFHYVVEFVDGGPLSSWSPLTDDGDAFRLAVKLAQDITNYSDYVEVDGICQDWGLDACTSLRRAIVRAAAQIGKAMP